MGIIKIIENNSLFVLKKKLFCSEANFWPKMRHKLPFDATVPCVGEISKVAFGGDI
jgi:hypothetical protein